MFDVFAKPIYIGIDAGHHSVKCAVLSDNKKEILELTESELMPDRNFIEQIPDDEAGLPLMKKTLEKYIDTKAKFRPSISASIHGEGAFYFYLELPKLRKEELEVAARSLTVKQIPIPLAEASLTNIPVPCLSSDKGKSGMFVIALRKNLIKRCRELYKKAGINLERLEPHLPPAIRGMRANHSALPGDFIAGVHAGSRLTSVVVLREGNPYYMRDFAISGRDFTYAFQMGAQSTWKEAEEYKRNYNAAQREIALEAILAKWLDQVKRSLDSFCKQFKDKNPTISRVYLSGGTARLKGLDARLHEVLNLPVIVDDWERLRPGKNSEGAAAGTFNIAVGLCL